MASFIIDGQRSLQGSIAVSGAKNAALKLIAATLLIDQPCTLRNVPAITDVSTMLELLTKLGATVEWQDQHTVTIDCGGVSSTALDPSLAEKLRASIMLIAPLLARFGEATLTHPGGCVIGKRPIDLFLEGYQALGARLKHTDTGYRLTMKSPRATTIVFPWISHTVTESMLLAAALIPGQTTLINAAQEPEVVNLAAFLNEAGARVNGAGTSTITVVGKKRLSGVAVEVIPDRLETGTFAILGLLAADQLTITNCQPHHLDVLWQVLKRSGAAVTLGPDTVSVRRAAHLVAQTIHTHEYPGLATDLQPPVTVLLTQAQGVSLVHETVYEGRLYYTDLLAKMGASIIMADPHRVIVVGQTPLSGTELISPDIRAGMALVIAGLIAKGKTALGNVDLIDRGYERLDERLRAIGAAIERR